MEERQPFPLLALVGQPELKAALILGLINPNIGGVLVSGPYGVGKTTAVRGLLDIMPLIAYEGEDQQGKPTRTTLPMRLVELPLNARIEDVVGGINERVAIEQHTVLLEDGILAKAHRNVLYVDEINLLDPHVADVILDAAAQGQTMVRRGAMVRLFPSRFVLVGSMNPEEGALRPQIMDRFGLRVWVRSLTDTTDRLEIYRRNQAYRNDPASFRLRFAQETELLRDEVAVAREILPHVVIPPELEMVALALVQELKIPSHRAEIALLEAVRARAAADFRGKATLEDIERMAPLALRQRRSSALESYHEQIQQENQMIQNIYEQVATAVSVQDDTLRQASRVDVPADRQRISTVRKIEEQG